ncbi:unnamed protein product [Schistosoma margrebowiei]|uniref:Uncharacterized protein n=1 Tax=Schistosoma margrebowiei TaxID=48269 RepID=A0A183MWD2_9TREM|nr:unnamed protein product [Schistosoma margrebowiei]
METLSRTQVKSNTAIINSRTRTENVKAQAEHTEANKQVKRSIRTDKQKYLEEIATIAEKASREGNIKQLYDITKKLAGKCSEPERAVKYKSITEIQGQRNRWEEYFEELLNRPVPSNPPDSEVTHMDLPIDVTPPTIEEIGMVIRQIKSAKPAGPYNIPV